MLALGDYKRLEKFRVITMNHLKVIVWGRDQLDWSKAYRAIYVADKSKNIALVKILEVNKHEY
jgi:hypothetical protein